MKTEKEFIELKIKITASFFLAVLLFSIATGAIRTGLYIHNEDQNVQLDTIELEKRKNVMICGDIVDHQYKPIISNTEKGICSLPPVEYTYLIGGLDSVLGDTGVYYANKQKLFEKEGWFSNKGKSLVLTIDDQLQRKCFALAKGSDSSICIMERKSGKILALTSTDQKYNLDLNVTNSEEIQTYINNKCGYYLANYSKPYCPGSVFKIMTAAILCENGKQDFTVQDSGRLLFDEGIVNNYGNVAYGKCNIERGFINSSNVYFATAANEVGAQAFKNLFDKMNIENITTDFGTINNSLNISDSPSDFELAQLGYGQQSTIDTVSIALIAQALLEGRLYKPHIVAAIAKYNGESIEVIDEIQEEVLCDNIVKKSTSDKLTSLMRSAAESYGFKNGILAKTGTGEVLDDNGHDTNRAVIVVADESHILVISALNEKQFGIDLKEYAEKIFQFLQASGQ